MENAYAADFNRFFRLSLLQFFRLMLLTGDVMKTKPWMMLVTMMAGWINRQQQDAIAYLKEENNILRDELLKATGKKRILGAK